jgi:uncharacterized protein (DUF952 family)
MGWFHLSTSAQLAETLDLRFPGQNGLVIAAIDLIALGRAVRWERSRQGQLFPLVYAPLARDVVIAWCTVEQDSKNAVRLNDPTYSRVVRNPGSAATTLITWTLPTKSSKCIQGTDGPYGVDSDHALGVAACNPNRTGSQSAQFPAQINCN